MKRLTGVMIMSLALLACDACRGISDRDADVPRARLASPEARARGREIFLAKCALCHGVDADGRGVRVHALSGRPVNFRSSHWRSRATPAGVYSVLRNGVRGTSMPAWPSLSESEKWDVVSYVLSVGGESP